MKVAENCGAEFDWIAVSVRRGVFWGGALREPIIYLNLSGKRRGLRKPGARDCAESVSEISDM